MDQLDVKRAVKAFGEQLAKGMTIEVAMTWALDAAVRGPALNRQDVTVNGVTLCVEWEVDHQDGWRITTTPGEDLAMLIDSYAPTLAQRIEDAIDERLEADRRDALEWVDGFRCV